MREDAADRHTNHTAAEHDVSDLAHLRDCNWIELAPDYWADPYYEGTRWNTQGALAKQARIDREEREKEEESCQI